MFIDAANNVVLISINLDSISVDLYVLTSFLTLYLLLLAMESKVPPFEDSAVVHSKVKPSLLIFERTSGKFFLSLY